VNVEVMAYQPDILSSENMSERRQDKGTPLWL